MLLHKFVREDDKMFHMLVVPENLSKSILHKAHNAIGHNGTARTYWYLKWIYCWKRLWKDVNAHEKQCIKCRQQNLYLQHYA